LSGFVRRLRDDLRMVRADEIARRYFVLNAFDGALTTIGLVMGAYFAGVASARVVLVAGLGANVAMGLSGAWGAYMSESAERTRAIKELERAMFAPLEDSVIGRASRTAVVFIALLDALSPIATSFVCLSPLFLSAYGVLPLGTAVGLAFLTAAFILFMLGIFLGRVSKTNVWLHGGVMILAGFLVMGAAYLIGLA
jgi:predicted membrane protein (TIGR00267 family)